MRKTFSANRLFLTRSRFFSFFFPSSPFSGCLNLESLLLSMTNNVFFLNWGGEISRGASEINGGGLRRTLELPPSLFRPLWRTHASLQLPEDNRGNTFRLHHLKKKKKNEHNSTINVRNATTCWPLYILMLRQVKQQTAFALEPSAFMFIGCLRVHLNLIRIKGVAFFPDGKSGVTRDHRWDL